ncbi:hypothetical protein acdb102_09960 [Acidothermaceae bacterium B102]|nr:hypothetical protein acdb102_09960 [Acidothermaceae bacterium B102]
MSGHGEPEMLWLPGEDVASTPDRVHRRRGRQRLASVSAVAVVALVVVLAAVISRDAGNGKPPAGSLSNQLAGRWSLASITSGGTTWQAPVDSGFSLTFTSGGYTGNDSCNGTSGTLTYGSGTVRLGPGAMTELGCIGADKDRMQTAFRLLIDQDLPAAVLGKTVTLTAGQTVFALSRVEPAVPLDLRKALPGTTWALVSIGQTGADVSSSTNVASTVYADISFAASNFVADDGCNSHGGTVSYAPHALTLGGGSQTAAACPEPTGDIGAAYGKILNGTVRPTLVGESLTIADGTGSLTFTRETPAYVEQRLTANSWNLVAVNGAVASGWTLTMTATSYRAQSQCIAHDGSVSYAGPLSMWAGMTEGTCVPATSVAGVEKGFATVFAGPVNVAFSGSGVTLSAKGATLSFAPGNSASTVPPSPGPSLAATGIPNMKGTLTATTWHLESLTTPTESWHAIAGSHGTLTFADSTYQVSNGCEGEGFAVSYDGAAAVVTFARGGQGTGMACSLGAEPPKGSVPPQAFFDALYGPLHVALGNDTLTLTRTGVVLHFSRPRVGLPAPSGGASAHESASAL